MPKWDFDVPESIKAWEDTKLPNDIKYKRIGKTLESFKRKAAKR